MDVAPLLRPVVSGTDLDSWARLKSAIVPNEPVTAEQIHATGAEGRLLLLAEVDGDLAGCGIAARSHFAGRGFVAPRVLPDFRRRGVGTALLLALADHVRSLDREELISFVYADEPESVAFAERFQQEVVDYQLEQIRLIGAEEPLAPPQGVEIVDLGDRREELLRAAWPVALEGYADMPLPGDVSFDLDEWLRDEATRPRRLVRCARGRRSRRLRGSAGARERLRRGRARADGRATRPAAKGNRTRAQACATRVGRAKRPRAARHLDAEGQ